MNKAVLATMCFVSGAALGFLVGYNVNKKKQDSEDSKFVEPIYVEKPKAEEKVPEVVEPEPEKSPEEELEEKFLGTAYKEIFKPAKIANKPGTTGINYRQYVKDLKYKQETQSPPEDDPEDEGKDIPEEELNMEDYEETFEEKMEREARENLEEVEEYKREHAGQIDIMDEEDWNTDFPEADYEREDLYYFVSSDVLTDEDGNVKDEKETIGPRVRQMGWMNNSDEVIYIRNHPKEMEYRVFKQKCAVEDWF